MDDLWRFYAGTHATGFPTVRIAICRAEGARDFLMTMGLTEPDPVDDVIRNILPLYDPEETRIDRTDYKKHVNRIVAALRTDSNAKREALIDKLRETTFVAALDCDSGATGWAMPGSVYLSTASLTELLSGVVGALVVDESHDCLRGEDARGMLEACGVTRYLRPVREFSLDSQQKRELRLRFLRSQR